MRAPGHAAFALAALFGNHHQLYVALELDRVVIRLSCPDLEASTI